MPPAETGLAEGSGAGRGPASSVSPAARSDARLTVTETVISVRGLHMAYGDFEAVRGIDVQVCRGEVFAFLGPNGAGKTTTVEILEGYLQAERR